MRPLLVLGLSFSLSLMLSGSMTAQLPAPNDAGVGMGHVHLNVRDVELHKKLWVDHFGAVPLRKPDLPGVKLPGLLLLFEAQAPTAGSGGTVLDHFGLKVRNLAETLRRWRDAGYDVQREFKGTEGFPNAYLLAPDAVRIELQEETTLAEPAIGYHLHYMLAEQLKLRDWYVDTFSMISGHRGTHEAADIPGMNLSFTPVKRAPIGTRGRAIDHVGFEVRNLEAFCRKLEARGVTFDVPYRKLADRDLALAMLTDPFGVLIELTEGLSAY